MIEEGKKNKKRNLKNKSKKHNTQISSLYVYFFVTSYYHFPLNLISLLKLISIKNIEEETIDE